MVGITGNKLLQHIRIELGQLHTIVWRRIVGNIRLAIAIVNWPAPFSAAIKIEPVLASTRHKHPNWHTAAIIIKLGPSFTNRVLWLIGHTISIAIAVKTYFAIGNAVRFTPLGARTISRVVRAVGLTRRNALTTLVDRAKPLPLRAIPHGRWQATAIFITLPAIVTNRNALPFVGFGPLRAAYRYAQAT